MAPEDVAVAFFSYCREDSEFALKLAEDLKVAGAHVWIDQLDIEPGTPWDRAVEAALTNSPRMLVVLSPVSVNSDNVRDEVSFALSRQKRVIPVLYRDCEVPFRLARLQHIDFRPDYARALSILVRALGVGHTAPSHVPSGAVAAAGVESAVSPAETEEKARQQKLEEERRLAAEQAQREEARKHAFEQSRLEKEREAAAEQAAREQHEQQRLDAEVRAHQEQPRREQRAAEQARLEEEARLAAERVRLAQQEQERREAEIKARQEQLRREEEESVERKSLNLGAEPQPARKAAEQESHPGAASPSRVIDQPPPPVEPRRAPERARIEPSPPTAPEVRVAPPKQPQATGLNLASPKYLAGGVVLLGLIIFLLARRGGPEKTPENKAETKAAQTAAMQQSPSQVPTGKTPSDSTASPVAQPNAPPASTSKQDQAKEKPKAAATDANDPAKAKNLARPPAELAKLNPSADSSKLNASNAANNAADPNRVRVSQGVSHGMLIHQVKPAYPPLARSARVEGQVVLDVVIGKNGAVKSITAQSGHPMLIPAAIDAVKQWRYQPYKLDGKPIEVDTQVLVNFNLN